MAIIHARVDERLIHGQVAAVWTRTTNTERIAVVNDVAVKDQMQIGALGLARPTGMKLTILSKRRALITLNDGRYDDRVFLLTKSIADMRAMVDGGVKVETVNIGNIAPHRDAEQVKRSVYLDDKDKEDIQAMLDAGVNVTAQMVPNEPASSITSFYTE